MAESVKLAFIASLQVLPPRQRAVLILRDVLAWSAVETADAIGMSVGAANSALHRARRRMEETHHAGGRDAVGPEAPDDPAVNRLLDAYVRAWQEDDVDGLVSIVREDVRLAMPPLPSWYSGCADVVAFLRAFVMPQGVFRLEAASANAQPAFVIWVSPPDGSERLVGIQVLDVLGGLVASIDNFLTDELADGFLRPT